MATVTELQSEIETLKAQFDEVVERIEGARGNGKLTWKIFNDELQPLSKLIQSKKDELAWLLIPEN